VSSDNDEWYGPTSEIVDEVLAKRRPDVLIRSEGSVFVFTPITAKAKQWFDANVSAEDWQWLGASLIVEHRYAPGLIAELLEAGLSVG
jgi:hypothetical protein